MRLPAIRKPERTKNPLTAMELMSGSAFEAAPTRWRRVSNDDGGGENETVSG